MAHIQIRISDEEKQKAQKVFSSMGLNLSSALKLFIRKSIQENKIPFEILGKEQVHSVQEEGRVPKEAEPNFFESQSLERKQGNISESEKEYKGVSGFIRKKIGL